VHQVLPLQHLQHLQLSPMSMPHGWQPRHLLKLVQLKTLALHHFEVTDALLVAATWRLLPQLSEIRMVFRLGKQLQPCSDIQYSMRTLLAAAGAATQLTSLHVQLMDCNEVGHLKPLQACEGLAQLANLKELTLSGLCMARGDALALTALTGLTRLQLEFITVEFDRKYHVHPEGKAAATALARSLTQLCGLVLEGCGYDMGSEEFLAAIGRLQRLTELRLGGDGLTPQGLMQLPASVTGLSRLQRLDVTPSREVADKVMKRFLAAAVAAGGSSIEIVSYPWIWWPELREDWFSDFVRWLIGASDDGRPQSRDENSCTTALV
jgi:hypothetical protein